MFKKNIHICQGLSTSSMLQERFYNSSDPRKSKTGRYSNNISRTTQFRFHIILVHWKISEMSSSLLETEIWKNTSLAFFLGRLWNLIRDNQLNWKVFRKHLFRTKIIRLPRTKRNPTKSWNQIMHLRMIEPKLMHHFIQAGFKMPIWRWFLLIEASF